ncbi:methylenetetrahydrofolate reductase [NAD(P)H] [Enterococcus pallens]|uniref:Methylenetetrahydrofolate reductase n=1 Tax=Enterococcus pallens ATCC BAA-351 TaxID=1158607 RepID=R2T2C7_9ENTE|nr:methylenetetrahydrofolate reductase [NAD(P)H] [Enterococcus pallens]EOH94399.1 5,10-methylenetetrahydrofolate reductase [Enterococcus pallens ATCC BAA-351]EOU24278.1 5,10-methylenetetrahydrofolate reductase [Enterococcus pallens ATCC BAA-351]
MQSAKTSLSFEVFPPTSKATNDSLFTSLKQMEGLSPDFISVTCSNRQTSLEDSTVKIAEHIQQQHQVDSIVHLTAAYLNEEEVDTILTSLQQKGLQHILALRGDLYPDVQRNNDFLYASDLIAYIKHWDPSFSISAACYPQGHPESSDTVEDIHYLKQKVEAGADQLITQMFFDNQHFYQFQENCWLAGINVPILAGIMPIINKRQAERILRTANVQLPKKFMAILDKYADNPVALRDAGMAYAVDQIVDLVTQGASGIHLYTMNNASIARTIYKATHSLFDLETITAVGSA